MRRPAILVRSCARVQLEVKRERFLWRHGPVFEGIDCHAQSQKYHARLAG